MKILVLTILAATAINAFAQTCPAAAQDEAALALLKATPIDSEATREKNDEWIKYHEQRIARARADCKKTPEELAAERAKRDAETTADRNKNNPVITRRKLVWETDPGSLADVANQISFETQLSMISAKGAVQVTQLASELQIEYSKLLMRQNDEIIRLLRIMAKQKK